MILCGEFSELWAGCVCVRALLLRPHFHPRLTFWEPSCQDLIDGFCLRESCCLFVWRGCGWAVRTYYCLLPEDLVVKGLITRVDSSLPSCLYANVETEGCAPPFFFSCWTTAASFLSPWARIGTHCHPQHPATQQAPLHSRVTQKSPSFHAAAGRGRNCLSAPPRFRFCSALLRPTVVIRRCHGYK